jgi:hypothetical protein
MDRTADTLVEETNQLRAMLGPRSEFKAPEFLQRLAGQLQKSQRLIKEPIVACLIEDLRTFGDSGRLVHTKRHINNGDSNYVFSMFNVSYFPSLSLDFLAYRKLDVPGELAGRFPSNTCPVTLERQSSGFEARVVVALFPENHVDGRQDPDDRIFYFIDKFVERHLRITRRMIQHVMAPGSFALLADASGAEIEKAASHWVWLHEYFHRQGHMPIPRYLDLKSLKPLAGLEELRVDISGLLACLHEPILPERLAQSTYQFILAERLLRYPVEGSLRPNYDAVSSQLLFNYLLRNGGVGLSSGLITLNNSLPIVLAMFLSEVTAIESRIYSHAPSAVQQELLNFVHEYVQYNPQTHDYEHIEFFRNVKQTLGV